MSTEIIVALIAFGGVIISVIVSVMLSARQTSNELTKLRTEIQQTYADKLLVQRLEQYPKIYRLLSEFGKKIESGVITKDDLATLHREVNTLNSTVSLLFSGHTSDVSFRLRKYFSQILQQDDEYLKSTEVLKDIKERIGRLELALKSDLGIFIVEFSDPEKRFLSYSEASKAVDEMKKHRFVSPLHENKKNKLPKEKAG